MGQGQDKIAKSLLELQPTAIVELFLIYFNYKDDPDSFFAFHGGSLFQKPIIWQGIEYLPLPVETEGFEVNANGRIARPKIKISNKDYIITDLLISFNDLQFSRLIRKRTFIKYLDNENFINGNPWGQQDFTAELSNDTFLVSQKTAENKLFVEFELTSQLDIDSWDINNRKILSTYCSFTYRGDGCYYNQLPLTNDKDETLFISARSEAAFAQGDPNSSFEWKNNYSYLRGDIVVVEDKNNIIDYYQDSVPPNNLPTYGSAKYLKNYYVAKNNHISSLSNSPTSINRDATWHKDQCIKTINACKKRFNSTPTTPGSRIDSIEIPDKYIDFTTKIPSENTGICLELAPTAQLNDFFNTGFYNDSFTIAMWISMPKKPARTNYPYSLFTNANHITQNDTEGAFALSYYLWNTTDPTPTLAQNVKIRKSDGTWKKNGIYENFWPNGGQVAVDGSYQLLLFECSNPKNAGGYVQLSINNNAPPEKLILGAGEQFSFVLPEYNSYRTGHFKINANNIWSSSWYDQSPRVTPANIHSVIIWSRLLNDAEKLWLGRKDIQPFSSSENEKNAPRLTTEITSQYESLITNKLELWFENKEDGFNSNSKQQLWRTELKAGQTEYDVYLRVTGLNNDLKNEVKNVMQYTYPTYNKITNDWLPFGGFPATYKFAYGEV